MPVRRSNAIEVFYLISIEFRFLSRVETNTLPDEKDRPVSLGSVITNLREGRPMKESAVAVCAITGGVISQLVMKMVTEGEGEDTAFEFDAVSGNGTLYSILLVCLTMGPFSLH